MRDLLLKLLAYVVLNPELITKDKYGLCCVSGYMVRKGFILDAEYNQLYAFIMDNGFEEDGIDWGLWIWEPYKLDPRIKFLKDNIAKLE